MGRPSWATPAQATFLEFHLSKLEREREDGNGLGTYYESVAREFLKRFPVKPTDDDELAAVGSEETPQDLANTRQTKVSPCLCPLEWR